MHAVSLLFHDVYAADPRESGFASDAADRYKLSAQAFDAQLEGLAGVRKDTPALVTNLIACGANPSGSPGESPPHRAGVRGGDPGQRLAPHAANPFLITVDDGGVSYYTMLADRLEALGWRGHCFVSTDAIGSRGFLDVAQIRELDARGHVIGSHSASHPSRFSACSVERMQQEWTRSRQLLEDLLGHQVVVASVPGGYYSRTVAHAARDAGLRLLFTSEPITSIRDEQGCTVIGRFTIRRGDSPDTARRLVLSAPWPRWSAWASWNAKGLIKPLLGPAYTRVADLVLGGSKEQDPPYVTTGQISFSAGPKNRTRPT
jgi:peptidoglycan/xylan/chitin deacetylase (PgdA/CDA1 family)